MDFYNIGMRCIPNDERDLPHAIRLPPPKNENDYKIAPKIKNYIKNNINNIPKGTKVVTGRYLGNIGSRKKKKKRKGGKKTKKNNKKQ